MAYIATENDLRLILQRNKIWSLRIEVLNTRFQILETIEGEALSAQLSISAESDMRRTCTLDMYVKNASYQISESSYFWLDKYIRVYYCLEDIVRHKTNRYPLGTFMLSDNSYSYNATERRLSLSLVDFMAKGTDVRGSSQGAQQTLIEVGSNIRGAMIAVLTQMMALDRYRIIDFPSGQIEVPYDLEFSTGAYPYEILRELCDLYPCREIYFDVDGTFVCGDVPSGVDEPLTLDSSYIDPLLISEQRNISFSSVKNVTEIWGKEIEAERTATACSSSGTIYTMTVEGITAYDDGVSYCFIPNADNAAGMQLRINALTAYPIVVRQDNSDGTTQYNAVEAGVMLAGRPYVVYYTGNRFLLYGELSIHAIAMAVNTEPTSEQKQVYQEQFACNDIKYVVNPQDVFAVERLGIIRQTLSGNDYDNIYTTALALDRAAYENWKTTRLQDAVTLEIIAIPWLDVNQLIEYTSPSTGEVIRALTQEISFDLAAGTMSVTASKYYPYYPW